MKIIGTELWTSKVDCYWIACGFDEIQLELTGTFYYAVLKWGQFL